jgi:hypothetical protein
MRAWLKRLPSRGWWPIAASLVFLLVRVLMAGVVAARASPREPQRDEANSMNALELRQLSRRIGDRVLLDQLSLWPLAGLDPVNGERILLNGHGS